MPRLSIITINKNNSKGLEKTIQGVISQTFRDFEYIVIDGASTDGSVDVIRNYEDKITYWVSEPDKGIFNAMNKGVLKARGEYIQFSNSGDWFVNSEVLSSVFKDSHEEDVVFGNIIKVKDGIENVDKGVATSAVTFYHLYLGTINHPATFARRYLFDKYGFFSEKYKYVNDWEWFLRTVGLANTSVKYLDQNISFFDMAGNSNETYEYFETERKPILKDLVPGRILEDYKRLFEYEEIFRLIKKYKISQFILKLALKYAKA